MLIEIFIDNTSCVHMILKCQVNNANMICKTQNAGYIEFNVLTTVKKHVQHNLDFLSLIYTNICSWKG